MATLPLHAERTTAIVLEGEDRGAPLTGAQVFAIIHRAESGHWATFGLGAGVLPTTVGPCETRQELLAHLGSRFAELTEPSSMAGRLRALATIQTAYVGALRHLLEQRLELSTEVHDEILRLEGRAARDRHETITLIAALEDTIEEVAFEEVPDVE